MFDNAQLLLAWERGFGRPPFERAIVMLVATLPGVTSEQIAQMSIGQRDAALLRLRKQLFGERLETLADCPQCQETMELNIWVDDIMLDTTTDPCTQQIEADEMHVQFRLPNSIDLARLQSRPAGQRRDDLLAACITRVSKVGKSVEPSQLTSSVKDQVATTMAEKDPQADVRFDLTCVACGHAFRLPFDIASFLWTELNAWAQRLLAEIHILAKAYGWSQRDILSLSGWRSQVYLNMVRQ